MTVLFQYCDTSSDIVHVYKQEILSLHPDQEWQIYNWLMSYL